MILSKSAVQWGYYTSSLGLRSTWTPVASLGLVHDRSDSVCILCHITCQLCTTLPPILEVSIENWQYPLTWVHHLHYIFRYTLFIVLYPMGVGVSYIFSIVFFFCNFMLFFFVVTRVRWCWCLPPYQLRRRQGSGASPCPIGPTCPFTIRTSSTSWFSSTSEVGFCNVDTCHV